MKKAEISRKCRNRTWNFIHWFLHYSKLSHEFSFVHIKLRIFIICQVLPPNNKVQCTCTVWLCIGAVYHNTTHFVFKTIFRYKKDFKKVSKQLTWVQSMPCDTGERKRTDILSENIFDLLNLLPIREGMGNSTPLLACTTLTRRIWKQRFHSENASNVCKCNAYLIYSGHALSLALSIS